jgi:hypothetical protein
VEHSLLAAGNKAGHPVSRSLPLSCQGKVVARTRTIAGRSKKQAVSRYVLKVEWRVLTKFTHARVLDVLQVVI